MNNASLVPVIETVVDEKVQAGELFTAHDVTIEVRSRGHRTGHGEVRDAVHDYYGRGGLGVAYTRTNISVLGGNPYLYHRGADDVSTYHNVRGGGNNPTPVVTHYVAGGQKNSTIQVPPVGQSGDDDDGDGAAAGQTVTIPSILLGSLLDSLSSVPQNSVAGIAISGTNGHARNSSTRTSNKPGNTKARTVDGRGTLSIPAPIIRQLGFKPRQKVYAVAATNGVDIVATQPPASAVYSTFTVDDHEQVRLTQALLQRAGIAGTQYDVEQLTNKVVVKLSK